MLGQQPDTTMGSRTMQPIEYDVLKRMELSAFSNMVLVKVPNFEEDRTTKGGILLNVNKDTQYFSEGDDESSHMADTEIVRGVVEKVPPGLLPDGDLLPRHIDMELQVGDEIIWDYYDSRHSVSFVCGPDEFRLLNYASCYLAIRDGELICLNGYALFEDVFVEFSGAGEGKNKEIIGQNKDGGPVPSSGILLSTSPQLEKLKGRVYAIGTPVEYTSEYYSDDIDIAPGDLVEFRKKFSRIYLERAKHFQTLDKRLFRAQRREIILNRSAI